jgi:response regulator RpfG family c-di-GMP phosphodiesterase
MLNPIEFVPGAHTLLVLDDEEIVRVALRVTLERQGYKVVTHSSPLEALEAVRSTTFSAIITDQQMPQMTGLDFLSRAKEVQPDATRILITAVLSLDTVIDAINRGEIYRFIVKPWLREELMVTVRNAVQRFELIGSNRRLQQDTQLVNERLREMNQALERQVTLAAEQNKRLDELNQALDANLLRSIELCLHTMETFYPSLGAQARRVHHVCRAMAEELKLEAGARQVLEVSAWLHPIGLVGIPRSLIRRWQENPTSLSGPEKILLHQHPILGAELAQFVYNLREVGATIRSHRERIDGSGYPDGLRGQVIPWLARLLGAAVEYAECKGGPKESMDRLMNAAGQWLDADAVRVLVQTLPRMNSLRSQREVRLDELQVGMTLASSIYSANGMLLAPEGQRLTPVAIDKLLNHHRLNPIDESLLIYC